MQELLSDQGTSSRETSEEDRDRTADGGCDCAQVDFWQPSGALITNTISDGGALEDGDLNMTYTFEWRYPDVVEGSEEHREKWKQSVEGAKMAVHSSIVAMRMMAERGELE